MSLNQNGQTRFKYQFIYSVSDYGYTLGAERLSDIFRETQYLYENKQQKNSSYRKKINCKKKKNEKLYFHSSFA